MSLRTIQAEESDIILAMDVETAEMVRDMIELERRFLVERIQDDGPITRHSIPLDRVKDLLHQFSEQMEDEP